MLQLKTIISSFNSNKKESPKSQAAQACKKVTFVRKLVLKLKLKRIKEEEGVRLHLNTRKSSLKFPKEKSQNHNLEGCLNNIGKLKKNSKSLSYAVYLKIQNIELWYNDLSFLNNNQQITHDSRIFKLHEEKLKGKIYYDCENSRKNHLM